MLMKGILNVESYQKLNWEIETIFGIFGMGCAESNAELYLVLWILRKMFLASLLFVYIGKFVDKLHNNQSVRQSVSLSVFLELSKKIKKILTYINVCPFITISYNLSIFTIIF